MTLPCAPELFFADITDDKIGLQSGRGVVPPAAKDYEEGAVKRGRWGGVVATGAASSSKQVVEFMTKNNLW